jgi:hypothetical protein
LVSPLTVGKSEPRALAGIDQESNGDLLMLWIASHFGPNGARIKTIPLQQGRAICQPPYVTSASLEGRAQIEPRGIGKLAGIRRCMNLCP